jgi:hypothetical protein
MIVILFAVGIYPNSPFFLISLISLEILFTIITCLLGRWILSVYRDYEKDWTNIIVTDNYFIMGQTNSRGLPVHELFNNDEEPKRFVFAMELDKVNWLKIGFADFMVKNWLEREDLCYLKMNHDGVVFKSDVTSSYFLPTTELTNFLLIMIRLNPRIVIRENLHQYYFSPTFVPAKVAP